MCIMVHTTEEAQLNLHAVQDCHNIKAADIISKHQLNTFRAVMPVL